MVRIVTIVAALAAVAAVSAPAAAAVKIETSVELPLPVFMPDLKPGNVVILDGDTDWPATPAAG